MRLDLFLVQYKHVPTRTRATNLIKLGGVFVNGKAVTKPAFDVSEQDSIVVEDRIGFASLGGLKLQEALRVFAPCVQGIAVDIGASNGGFTHCLIEAGAERVYAVDVGECALPTFLVDDPRVVPLPRTNARELTPALFGGSVDMVVADVSFISLTLIVPVVAALLKKGGWAILLVKPQFEVGPSGLTKTGIVRNDALRKKAVERVESSAMQVGLTPLGITPVPALFEDKNIEYLLYLAKED